MAFTDAEIAEHMKVLEDTFWSRRRPPLHLRDKVREGQRFTDRSIELFIMRPAFNRPGEQTEESIAKVLHLPRLRVWRLFWKRADGHWHRYRPCPETDSLADTLRVIDDHGSASLTRLTVLKKWFEHPGRLPAFGLWIAKRAPGRKGKTKADAGALLDEAKRLLGTTATREGFLRTVEPEPAKLLHDRAREFQNEFQQQQSGPVRIIHCWPLLLVEQGLALYLAAAASPSDGYKLAADFCQHHDSRHGNNLNGPSRTSSWKSSVLCSPTKRSRKTTVDRFPNAALLGFLCAEFLGCCPRLESNGPLALEFSLIDRQRQRRDPYQPKATPWETVRKNHQGLKARPRSWQRSIQHRAGGIPPWMKRPFRAWRFCWPRYLRRCPRLAWTGPLALRHWLPPRADHTGPARGPITN